MSDTKKLADRIATLLESEQQGDLAAIFASLEKIDHRLERLESSRTIDTPNPPAMQPILHPSLHKFAIAEAIAEAFGVEKACQFEPAKHCDHCSMCNSRGF